MAETPAAPLPAAPGDDPGSDAGPDAGTDPAGASDASGADGIGALGDDLAEVAEEGETVLSLLADTAAGAVQGVAEVSPRLGAAAVVLLATWLLARLAGAAVLATTRRMRMREALRDVLAMLVGVGVRLGGLLIAATLAFPSITPADALTAIGLGSVAIGFAFKDIFENFLAGILILLREPFKLGDHIRCGEIEGAVARITVRDSHLRRTDGQLVVLPNAYIFRNPVVVRTAGAVRRTSIIAGVAYGEDVDQARAVILDAVRRVDTVRDDVRDVQVFARAFGSSSIDFEVAWWTGSLPVDIRRSRDQVVAAIKRALDDAGIEIPFPDRTLVHRREAPSDDPDDADDADEGPDADDGAEALGDGPVRSRR